MAKLFKSKQAQAMLIGYAGEPEVTALFELLGMVAKAGDYISKNQIQEMERFIHSHLTSDQRNLAISAFRSGKEVALLKGTVTIRAFKLYGLDGQRWLDPIQVLDILLRVSMTDHSFSKLQEYLIDSTRASLAVHKRTYWILRDTLAERLGIDLNHQGPSFAGLDSSKKKAPGDKQQSNPEPRKSTSLTKPKAFEVLELSEEATSVEIKTAHRAMVKRYHPDFLANKKTTDSALKEAIKRFCEIQEAYELLMETEKN